jgi:hypothetical protein
VLGHDGEIRKYLNAVGPHGIDGLWDRAAGGALLLASGNNLGLGLRLGLGRDDDSAALLRRGICLHIYRRHSYPEEKLVERSLIYRAVTVPSGQTGPSTPAGIEPVIH